MIQQQKDEEKEAILDNVQKWLHMSWAYIELAQVACIFWVDTQKTDGYMGLTSARSYLATIFNIKHSIELFLKRLLVSLGDDLNGFRHHDIVVLFAGVQAKLDWARISEVIRLAKEAAPSDQVLLTAFGVIENEASFNAKIDELKVLVEKFAHLDMLNDPASVAPQINDPKNTSLRYPDDENIDYNNVVERITLDDFKDLKKDVNQLKGLYSDIGFALRAYAESQ